jgi:uncharacterized protein (DUF2237 family)
VDGRNEVGTTGDGVRGFYKHGCDGTAPLIFGCHDLSGDWWGG